MAAAVVDERQEILCQEECALQVPIDQLVELRLRSFRETRVDADSRIVDQRVEAFLLKSLHGTLHFGGELAFGRATGASGRLSTEASVLEGLTSETQVRRRTVRCCCAKKRGPSGVTRSVERDYSADGLALRVIPSGRRRQRLRRSTRSLSRVQIATGM